MKCRKCGQPAAFNMRRHKLALCETCYVDWFPEQVARTIKRYEMFSIKDRVLVAVSGGKDSLGLWDILLRMGYQADGLYINLGIQHQDYSAASLDYIRAFVRVRAWEGFDLRLHVADVKQEYGQSVTDLIAQRRGRKPCSLCGLIKRHIMNKTAHEGGYSVLATGHNLDDEAATLLHNALHWQTGYLGRQGPVLPAIHPRLAKKVKPLCLLYERESAAYALIRAIEYIYDECPYSVRAMSIFHKGLLDKMDERSPGAKLQFYLSFLQAKAEGRASFEELASPERQTCTECGQPTLAPGRCSFCRLWQEPESAVPA